MSWRKIDTVIHDPGIYNNYPAGSVVETDKAFHPLYAVSLLLIDILKIVTMALYLNLETGLLLVLLWTALVSTICSTISEIFLMLVILCSQEEEYIKQLGNLRVKCIQPREVGCWVCRHQFVVEKYSVKIQDV